jgi:hypothetical protein
VGQELYKFIVASCLAIDPRCGKNVLEMTAMCIIVYYTIMVYATETGRVNILPARVLQNIRGVYHKMVRKSGRQKPTYALLKQRPTRSFIF